MYTSTSIRGTKEGGKQWAHIEGALGSRFVHDVDDAIECCPPGYSRSILKRAARAFFGWLIFAPGHAGRRAVLDAYAGASATESSQSDVDIAILLATNACFQQFGNELPAYASVSGSTVWMLHRCAAFVLERLGQLENRRYPAFLTALHRRHQALGETQMLGSLAIAADIVTPPSALRERHALDRVGFLALEEFRDHIDMIDAALPIRVDAPSCRGADAQRECVHRVLVQAWSMLPVRLAGHIRHASGFVNDAPTMIADPAVWIAAGIPERCVRRFSPNGAPMKRLTVGQLTLACLGPSPTMVICGAAVVARARGWNKSSILSIPANPFSSTVQGKYGIVGGSFVVGMKARAGHPVAMFLSDPRHDDEVLVAETMEEWRATTSVATVDSAGEQMLSKAEPDDAAATAVLEVFHSLMRVAEPLRLHDGLYGSIDRLFAYPPLNKGDAQLRSSSLTLTKSTTPALAEGGVNFRAIRASWVYVEYEHRRSFTTTMATCGQATPRVTMRHYLNRKEVRAELRQALGFFQSICQTLVVSDGTTSLLLGLGTANLGRLRRLASASGMSAAFGLDAPQVDAAPVLRFTPTEANLRDLFLALWALRVAARVLPYATWRVRCLELFAAARAIATELRLAGLGTDYAAAARAAYADRRTGRVSLPHVEGS